MSNWIEDHPEWPMCTNQPCTAHYMTLLYPEVSPSQALLDDISALTFQRITALNEWATEQVRQGRDVMEHEIETGTRRMRPLRPDDV